MSAAAGTTLEEYCRQLTIELVPATCWWSNVRTLLPATDWDRCKAYVRRRSGSRCEVCGGRGPRWPVECHEIWGYDDDRHVQTLLGLVALCPSCHLAKHPGFAGTQGKLEVTMRHIERVNGWTRAQSAAAYNDAMATFAERSRHEWDLDLTWLTTIGVSLDSVSAR